MDSWMNQRAIGEIGNRSLVFWSRGTPRGVVVVRRPAPYDSLSRFRSEHESRSPFERGSDHFQRLGLFRQGVREK